MLTPRSPLPATSASHRNELGGNWQVTPIPRRCPIPARRDSLEPPFFYCSTAPLLNCSSPDLSGLCQSHGLDLGPITDPRHTARLTDLSPVIASGGPNPYTLCATRVLKTASEQTRSQKVDMACSPPRRFPHDRNRPWPRIKKSGDRLPTSDASIVNRSCSRPSPNMRWKQPRQRCALSRPANGLRMVRAFSVRRIRAF
jgi:hypothetical protein